MWDNVKLEHLRCTFPRLTETNQSYVLGLAEGLKQAQGKARGAVPVPRMAGNGYILGKREN